MLLTIVLATIVTAGLIAIALAHPHAADNGAVWNDEAERRMLRERTVRLGWW
jgi:hypothetical protein